MIFGAPKRRGPIRRDPLDGATAAEREQLAAAHARVDATAQLAEAERARIEAGFDRGEGSLRLIVPDAAMLKAEEDARLARGAEARLKRRIAEAVLWREHRAHRVRMKPAEIAHFRALGLDVPEDGLCTQGEREDWGAAAQRMERGEPVAETSETKIRRLEDRLLALEGGRGGAA